MKVFRKLVQVTGICVDVFYFFHKAIKIGFSISSSSFSNATNFALNNVFKSKGLSGYLRFSQNLVTNFLCSEEIWKSIETCIPEVEGFTTIWLFDIFTLFIILRSERLLIKLLLRIKK